METVPLNVVRAMFDAVCELPADERRRYLDENCGDEALRRRVESLLRSHDSGGQFLNTPAADLTDLRSLVHDGGDAPATGARREVGGGEAIR